MLGMRKLRRKKGRSEGGERKVSTKGTQTETRLREIKPSVLDLV